MQKEAMEQRVVIEWCRLQEHTYPELELIYHVPNGGSRNKIEAANLKRQGVKAGVPDLVLAVPKKGFHGLYIEMKHGNNKPTKAQGIWLNRLSKQGYKCKVCYSATEAIEAIKDYITGG